MLPGCVRVCGLPFGHRLGTGDPGLPSDGFGSSLGRERLLFAVCLFRTGVLAFLLGRYGLDGVTEVMRNGLVG